MDKLFLEENLKMSNDSRSKTKIRTYGQHLTPIEIFKKFILPDIRNELYDYIWVDLFAGEGNLILPILDEIPETERIKFFTDNIWLFDIQQEMVDKAIENALHYGIPFELAKEHITRRDTIKDYPLFLKKRGMPLFHITNPPYLYIGYIKKHAETQRYLDYFTGLNKGFQDLYQLALMNDLRAEIQRAIYIIPTNFLFGASVSNQIRDQFFQFYTITKIITFEKKIFDLTGTNVMICQFARKTQKNKDIIKFSGIKINSETHEREYLLSPINHYRAGSEFETFVEKYRSSEPPVVKWYLMETEVKANIGDKELIVVDANDFHSSKYRKQRIYVNDVLYKRIKDNILFIRTVDTGSMDGRAGLYSIPEVFEVDGIMVSKSPYRTHPIQLFTNLSIEDQILLKEYFNFVLEYFRDLTDSEFMTTYKYSDSKYVRKYLGLSQAKKLIETFPSKAERKEIGYIIKNRDVEMLIDFLNHVKYTNAGSKFNYKLKNNL
ncbi:MAG: N-6 DNA methylase [Athalassotoga sp.]